MGFATQSVQDVTAASRTPAETQAGTRPRSVRSGCFGMRLYLLRLSRNSESDGEEGDSAACGWQHCQNMEWLCLQRRGRKWVVAATGEPASGTDECVECDSGSLSPTPPSPHLPAYVSEHH